MPGQVLAKGEGHEIVEGVMWTKYRSGVGKLKYLATWSRLDILNAVREVSRHMQAPTKKHFEASVSGHFAIPHGMPSVVLLDLHGLGILV
jgi:hypothetical protein